MCIRDRLATIQRRLVEQRDIALKFHPDWHDFFSSHKLSTAALGQAEHVLNDIVERSLRSQHESHTRIMLRQIARNEYEPARTLIDVVAALKESLGAASTIQVSEFDVPQ
eukprot:855787-Prymnesium_polylepis.1